MTDVGGSGKRLLTSAQISESVGEVLGPIRGVTGELEQLFVCPICYETLRRPTSASCQHVFCEECITSWLSRQSTCPVCREVVTVRTTQPSVVLRDAIEKYSRYPGVIDALQEQFLREKREARETTREMAERLEYMQEEMRKMEVRERETQVQLAAGISSSSSSSGVACANQTKESRTGMIWRWVWGRERMEGIEEYRVLERRGCQSGREVYRAFHVPKGTTVAVKKLRVEKGGEGCLREALVLRECASDFVVPLRGLVNGGVEGSQRARVLYTVMPFFEFDLDFAIREGLACGASAAAQVSWQLFSALEYLHGRGVAHREVRPSSVLLRWTQDPEAHCFPVVLAGFGSVCSICDPEPPQVSCSCYHPPECHRGATRNIDWRAADVWGVAAISVEMLHCRLALACCAEVLSGLDCGVSPEFRSLMSAIMEPDPRSRPTASGALARCPLSKEDKAQLAAWRTDPSTSTRPAIDVSDAAVQQLLSKLTCL